MCKIGWKSSKKAITGQKITHTQNLKTLTWASCRVQHESHWNLLSLQRVSVLLKFFKQLVIEVFCSTSIDRSKKSSSLLVTVSQLRQRVSLVKMPWKMSEIQVGFLLSGWSLFIGVLLPLPLCCWLLSAEMKEKQSCNFRLQFKNKSKYYNVYKSRHFSHLNSNCSSITSEKPPRIS